MEYTLGKYKWFWKGQAVESNFTEEVWHCSIFLKHEWHVIRQTRTLLAQGRAMKNMEIWRTQYGQEIVHASTDLGCLRVSISEKQAEATSKYMEHSVVTGKFLKTLNSLGKLCSKPAAMPWGNLADRPTWQIAGACQKPVRELGSRFPEACQKSLEWAWKQILPSWHN